MLDLPEYMQRVVTEKQELDAKLAKLDAFINTVSYTALSGDEQGRLAEQRYHMNAYSVVLGDRIAAHAA